MPPSESLYWDISIIDVIKRDIAFLIALDAVAKHFTDGNHKSIFSNFK